MTTFGTKVDWWLMAIVIGAEIFACGMAVQAFRQSQSAAMLLIPVFFAGSIALMVPMRYTLAMDELVVRSGVIRWRVPYSAIESVEPTNNPLASPAFSLDRLAVRYGRRLVLISPRNRETFLRELANRAGLRFDGRRLTRG